MTHGGSRRGVIASLALRFVMLSVFSAVPPLAAWDLNGDGISDVYARQYNLSPGSANQDTDGDGATDLQESIAGTDPRNPASRFVVAVTVDALGASASWTGVLGKRYQVQRSTDMATWANLGSVRVGNDTALTHFEAGPLPLRVFYRVQIVPSLDTDGDGFDDWEESKLLASSAAVLDGDSDGLSDAYEVYYFGNLSRTGNDDSDGDLILAKDEYTFRLDPLADDTLPLAARYTYTANDELSVYTPVVGPLSTYFPDAEGNLRAVP